MAFMQSYFLHYQNEQLSERPKSQASLEPFGSLCLIYNPQSNAYKNNSKHFQSSRLDLKIFITICINKYAEECLPLSDCGANTIKDSYLLSISIVESNLSIKKGISNDKINMGSTVTLNIITTNKSLDVITGELMEYKVPDGCSFLKNRSNNESLSENIIFWIGLNLYNGNVLNLSPEAQLFAS